MKKSKVISAMLMAAMLLIAVPSCDKDSNTDEPSNVVNPDPNVENPDPNELSAIEKATLGKKVMVDELAETNTITWLRTDEFKNFAAKVAKFSSKAAITIGTEGDGNIAVSPLSVFIALAMSADCANGDTRQELLDALGVTLDELRTMNMRSLCYLMNRTLDIPINYFPTSTDPYSTSPDKAKNLIKCVNSLWLRNDVPAKEEELSELNHAYFADVLSMDFDNTNVNELVKSYISQETNGLLNPTFDLDENTAILLMNVLYLRDIWSGGEEYPLTDKKYDFVNYDKSTTSVNMLQGVYLYGRAFETETYRKFHTETNGGLDLTFFVPKDGHTLEEVYTEDVLNDKTTYYYKEVTTYPEHEYLYHTRCLFPEFEAKFDSKIQEAVQKMGVEKFFVPYVCDFSTLTDHGVHCEDIIHVTKLEVARKGIEGAAVTVVVMKDNAVGEQTWEDVYEDFVVDRDFAYVLSMEGIPVFTGVVKTVK